MEDNCESMGAKILRSKLCKVRTVDNLNIYTYQAKETDC